MSLPSNDSRLPPGPDEPVAIGVDPETLELLQGLNASYGNMVAMTKPNGRKAWFVNDANEVRKLLVRHHTRYKKGPGFERVKMLLGNGLIVSDGATWRRSRRMIQPAFTRQNVHRLIGLMVDCAMRRAAITHGVPYLTTMSATEAACDALIALTSREREVRSIQERIESLSAAVGV